MRQYSLIYILAIAQGSLSDLTKKEPDTSTQAPTKPETTTQATTKRAKLTTCLDFKEMGKASGIYSYEYKRRQ